VYPLLRRLKADHHLDTFSVDSPRRDRAGDPQPYRGSDRRLASIAAFLQLAATVVVGSFATLIVIVVAVPFFFIGVAALVLLTKYIRFVGRAMRKTLPRREVVA
jgi:hypothetical protein